MLRESGRSAVDRGQPGGGEPGALSMARSPADVAAQCDYVRRTASRRAGRHCRRCGVTCERNGLVAGSAGTM